MIIAHARRCTSKENFGRAKTILPQSILCRLAQGAWAAGKILKFLHPKCHFLHSEPGINTTKFSFENTKFTCTTNCWNASVEIAQKRSFQSKLGGSLPPCPYLVYACQCKLPKLVRLL